LKFEHDTEIGQKRVFFKGLESCEEDTMSNSIFSEETGNLIRQYRGEKDLESRLEEPHGTLMEVSPDFAKYTDEYLLADVMARPGLIMRERSMIIMAALAVNRYEFVSNGHMRWTLNIGTTREETLEVIIQISQYGGWPVGEELLGLMERAYPGYLKTVKEHPENKAMATSGLTVRERTLVDLGALTARRFSERLKKKMKFALSIGITREEILETIMQVTPFSGWPVGVEAIRAAEDIIGTSKKVKTDDDDLSERRQKGKNIIHQLCGGEKNDAVFMLIEGTCPDFMTVVTESHLFGEIWSRSLLSLRDRCMITIAVLTALRFGNELRAHMRFALNLGLSLDEVLEITMQSANYTCWGAGLEAARAAMDVFTSEQKETHPKYSSSELRERGSNIIRQLRGDREKDDLLTAIGQGCPDFLEVITTEHLFGEVWARPGLELRERCMIALAILVARRFDAELKTHMQYALNIGLSREEILEVILHTANYTCWGAGVEAIKASKEILGTA